MAPSLTELEARLVALEGGMSQLRLEFPEHHDLLVAVAVIADGIRGQAGAMPTMCLGGC